MFDATAQTDVGLGTLNQMIVTTKYLIYELQIYSLHYKNIFYQVSYVLTHWSQQSDIR